MNQDNVIAIKILDRNYKVKCPPDEAASLQLAAQHVDKKMRELRQSSNVTSTDRVAVVTALNICHELLQLKQQKNHYIDAINQRIQNLQERIENSMLEMGTEK